jgi:hypothetical protein
MSQGEHDFNVTKSTSTSFITLSIEVQHQCALATEPCSGSRLQGYRQELVPLAFAKPRVSSLADLACKLSPGIVACLAACPVPLVPGSRIPRSNHMHVFHED